jgi:hypothetical protein
MSTECIDSMESAGSLGARENPRREQAYLPVYFLLVLMGTLLLVGGLFSAWLIKRVETHYSALVSQTTERLNRIQDIGWCSSVGYASALEMPLTADAKRRTELLEVVACQRAANDKLMAELNQVATEPALRLALDEVIARRRAHREQVDALLEAGRRTPVASSEELAEKQSFQSFIQYQNACDKMGDLIRAKSLQANEQMAKDLRQVRWLLLGTSVLPIVIGLALFLMTLYAVWVSPAELDLRD